MDTVNEKKISVVINTYNAEKHLKEVLESVKDFDEILVCDMESTDSTLEIAKDFGCRIVTFPRGHYSIAEPARNFAKEQAKYEWIFSVDADEIVTPELKDYLYERISEPNCPDGLFVPRLNMYLGKYIHRFTRDHQLRFFKKDKSAWPEQLHSIPKVEGRIERIPRSKKNVQLMHLSDPNIAELVDKMNTYSSCDIERKQSKGYGVIALLYRPLWRFFRCYFIQGEFRYGLRGFINSVMNGFYQFILVAKIMENHIREKNN